MKRAKLNKRANGFTLIELLIVLAILGIVITAVSNYFVHNLNTYNKSEKVAQVQFDVRMASEYVTTALRNVDDIVLSSTAIDPVPFPNVIDLTTLTGKYASVNAVSFSLSKEGQRYFVSYTINGNSLDGKNDYTLSTKVLLNNIYAATESTGSIVYFVKN